MSGIVQDKKYRNRQKIKERNESIFNLLTVAILLILNDATHEATSSLKTVRK